MKIFFMAQGLCDVVEKGYEKTLKDHEKKGGDRKQKEGEEKSSWDETKQMLYLQNKNKDITTHAFIQQAVTPIIFPQIMATTTAKEVWSILKDAYRGTDKLISVKLQTL